jgi:3-deoxy-D-manno-octulosonate 8-phosphate phosphatase (KDO 8-P phosphatase)
MTDYQICFIGDDLVDVPVMKRAGLAACPSDARLPAQRVAHFVASERGGRGAVREVIEFILKAQGRWAKVTQDYL